MTQKRHTNTQGTQKKSFITQRSASFLWILTQKSQNTLKTKGGVTMDYLQQLKDQSPIKFSSSKKFYDWAKVVSTGLGYEIEDIIPENDNFVNRLAQGKLYASKKEDGIEKQRLYIDASPGYYISNDDPIPNDCKVEIYAAIPDRLKDFIGYSRKGTTKINVSYKKTPAQVVKEIQRRLFPDYLAELADMEERYECHETMIAATQANESVLFALNLKDLSAINKDEKSIRHDYQFTIGKESQAEIQVDPNGFTLTVNDITGEQLKKIIDIVR